VITDKATAQQIAVSTINFGVDTNKLRHVLANGFLITAVYRGSKALVSPPQIECAHSYFQLHASTNAEVMRTELATGAALGLLDSGASDALVGGVQDFGRTMAFAEASYGDELSLALFLNGADARPQTEYESAGREAVRLLVRPDAADAFRLRGVNDDSLWAQMRSAGQFNFRPLFPGLKDAEVQVIAADYSVIVWWAEAMSKCAACVASIRALPPGRDVPDSPEFQAARAQLAKALAEVAGNTKAEFGQPWGLVAMDRVSGGRASARVEIVGTGFAFQRSTKDLPAAAAGRS